MKLIAEDYIMLLIIFMFYFANVGVKVQNCNA